MILRRDFLKWATMLLGLAGCRLPTGAAPKPAPTPSTALSPNPRRLLLPPPPPAPDALRSWLPDIRQVLSDNAIRDMLEEEDSRFLNAMVFERLTVKDPAKQREAEDLVSAFTRMKMREDGYYRRAIPLVPVDNSQLIKLPGRAVGKSTSLALKLSDATREGVTPLMFTPRSA